MVVDLVAVVKSASEYGIDLAGVWDSFRMVFGIGLMVIALSAGFIFYRKLVS